MTESEPGRTPADEDDRLESLETRLKQAHQLEAVRTGSGQQGQDANTRLGNRVLAELVGGIAGGALVGWVIDRLAGTSPWALLVMMAFGIVVAFRNIIRLSNQRAK